MVSTHRRGSRPRRSTAPGARCPRRSPPLRNCRAQRGKRRDSRRALRNSTSQPTLTVIQCTSTVQCSGHCTGYTNKYKQATSGCESYSPAQSS